MHVIILFIKWRVNILRKSSKYAYETVRNTKPIYANWIMVLLVESA